MNESNEVSKLFTEHILIKNGNKQVTSLLTNNESLIRESRNVVVSLPEQTKLF